MKIEEIHKNIEISKKQALEINVKALDSEGVLCNVSKIKYQLSK